MALIKIDNLLVNMWGRRQKPFSARSPLHDQTTPMDGIVTNRFASIGACFVDGLLFFYFLDF
jgi:hypothetical protein